MAESEKDYEETIKVLSDKQLSKDLATGIQQIKENKLVDFETLKANNTNASKKGSWNNLEKSLSEFTPDYMADGRNQPETQTGKSYAD